MNKASFVRSRVIEDLKRTKAESKEVEWAYWVEIILYRFDEDQYPRVWTSSN